MAIAGGSLIMTYWTRCSKLAHDFIQERGLKEKGLVSRENCFILPLTDGNLNNWRGKKARQSKLGQLR